MGADKARMLLAGRALMEYPLKVLREVAGEVVLATGSEPRYEDLGLSCVLDPVADGGPLAGIASGLEAAEERSCTYVACLACDMPRASVRSLTALLERAEKLALDACLLETESGLEPLFAVYHRSCLAPVRAALSRGERRAIAFHGERVDGRPLRIGVVDAKHLGEDGCARNLNTPQEWHGECALLQERSC
jgi:molybdopterin-guanine dinucleotide biosynthesis protein A